MNKKVVLFTFIWVIGICILINYYLPTIEKGVKQFSYEDSIKVENIKLNNELLKLKLHKDTIK